MYGTYRKIEKPENVPKAGPLNADVREMLRLDFKETSGPDATFEHAKDMALFANGFGGVILIGSKVTDGIVEHVGIARAHAARMAEVYEQVAKDMCSPSPIVNAIIIAMPGSTSVLLAVNVDPTVEGPVGARARGQDAWVFPFREASQTKYLKPHELPMYMNPKLRRTILFLDRISNQQDDVIKLWGQPGLSARGQMTIGALGLDWTDATKPTVILDRNAVEFSIGEKRVSVPLTEIEDMWMNAQGTWNLRIAGRIEATGGGNPPQYVPVIR